MEFIKIGNYQTHIKTDDKQKYDEIKLMQEDKEVGKIINIK